MQRRWIDRGLVAAALVLVAVILAGALSHVSFGGHRASPATTQPKTVLALPVKPSVSIVVGQSDIELHGSPETEFLRRCTVDRLGLDVVRGQRVAIRYDGPPCHVPRLELTAVVLDPSGRVVNSRPALPDGALPNVLAGEQSVSAPLARGLLRCWAGRPLALHLAEHGQVLRGVVRCRGQR